jgi:hypothetical protein
VSFTTLLFQGLFFETLVQAVAFSTKISGRGDNGSSEAASLRSMSISTELDAEPSLLMIDCSRSVPNHVERGTHTFFEMVANKSTVVEE